jgi:hypothetical protein
MLDQTHVERRTLLGVVAAASGAALSSAILLGPAAAQPAGDSASGDSRDFETARIDRGRCKKVS